jgi:hypothetical protein
MSARTVLSILSILTLGGVLLVPVSGCSDSTTSGANTPSSSTEPAVPLLDTATHGSVETAYFALG